VLLIVGVQRLLQRIRHDRDGPYVDEVAVASEDVTAVERVPRVRVASARAADRALVFVFPFYYMIVGSLQKQSNTSLSGVLPRREATSRCTTTARSTLH